MNSTARSSLLEQHTWGAYLQFEIMSAPLTLLGLPLDLQFMLLDRLPLCDYVSLALAGYYELHRRHANLFPVITRSLLHSIRTIPTSDPLTALPNEMIENIAKYLDKRTLMSWVFAHYQTLATSNPPLVPTLTRENMSQLYLSWVKNGFF